MRAPASRLLAVLALALLPVLGVAIDSEEDFEDPGLQTRFEALTDELRCLVCQNQTIADSNATLAQDLRREVREMMLAGKSDDEIRTFMTERYGDFVLYRPPFAPRTWLLWLAPGLLLLLGAGVMVRIVTQRAALPIEDDEDDAARDVTGDAR